MVRMDYIIYLFVGENFGKLGIILYIYIGISRFSLMSTFPHFASADSSDSCDSYDIPVVDSRGGRKCRSKRRYLRTQERQASISGTGREGHFVWEKRHFFTETDGTASLREYHQ